MLNPPAGAAAARRRRARPPERQQPVRRRRPVARDANVTIATTNENALAALKGVTGKDFGLDRDAWLAWWTDRQGYAFKAAPRPDPAQKLTLTQFVDPYPTPRHSCFAAGTPVRTLDGPRPIEDLKVGDRVLTQDTATGALSYQPVLAVFHNPPAATLRVRLGGEAIVATGIHRFWKAGKGWTMARDLKPGDPIRRSAGSPAVESVEPDRVQPVFNLEVAEGPQLLRRQARGPGPRQQPGPARRPSRSTRRPTSPRSPRPAEGEIAGAASRASSPAAYLRRTRPARPPRSTTHSDPPGRPRRAGR